ncbi:MAG TPA: succinate dehydrogenase, hydrophobic membrane anchor protein [Oceanospirillaceae bacterium]|nr:succinate dehydrogenase, hydrophobic membrane anchor protein [Oceanospirillaceae bacterium]
MVKSVTSFGRSGLYDWLIQRVSAVVLAAYTVFMVVYLLNNSDLTYAQWNGLFSMTSMRIFSLMALMSLGAHTWIGLWSVSTDYIKPMGYRFAFQMVTGALMFAYTVWGIQLLWGL